MILVQFEFINRVKCLKSGQRGPMSTLNLEDETMKNNPMAKMVRTRAFRPRIVKSKKVYSRKGKNRPDPAVDRQTP